MWQFITSDDLGIQGDGYEEEVQLAVHIRIA